GGHRRQRRDHRIRARSLCEPDRFVPLSSDPGVWESRGRRGRGIRLRVAAGGVERNKQAVGRRGNQAVERAGTCSKGNRRKARTESEGATTGRGRKSEPSRRDGGRGPQARVKSGGSAEPSHARTQILPGEKL